MDFIIADKIRDDIGYIEQSAVLDLDIGSTFDFALTVNLKQYNSKKYAPGNILYCIGTEYGGVLDDPLISTSDNSVTFTGDTPRGILKKKVIQPPPNQAYRLISGELNTCLAALINEQFDTLFDVSDHNTGITISSYQFDRYCTLYDGIVKMLNSVGYRLKIEFVYIENKVAIQLSAVPIVDYSNDIEFSQDSNFQFKIQKYTNRYNCLIALGPGELTEREVVILYQDKDGTINVVQSVPKGDDVKVYIYDFSSSEALETDARNKFEGINTKDTYSMTIRDNLDIEIGDIVGGRDYVTGTVITQAVTKKIIKISSGKLTISYEIGGNK